MAAIYSNGGNCWNIFGFNFTKRDAISSLYKISMVHTGQAKRLLDRGAWNRICDLWFASPMLYHATELRGQVGSSAWYFGSSLVPSISVCFHDLKDVFLVVSGVMYSGEDI
jgi:hypothetical protein